MTHNLMSTIQMRMQDVLVDECPKFLATNPTDDTHSIRVPDEDGTVHIPLSLNGVTSYFPTRKPTRQELDDCRRIELTFSSPEWNPQDPSFADQENALVDPDGRLREPGNRRPNKSFISKLISDASRSRARQIAEATSKCAAVLNDIDPNLNEGHLVRKLRENRNVSLTSSTRKEGVDATQLAKNWGIGLHTARRTVETTTQKGVRAVLPALDRRLRTNDRWWRYKHLRDPVYGDIMTSKIKSKRQNKHAHVLCTDYGWSRSFPIQTKGEAQDAIDLMHHRDGIPPKYIVDGAKEFVLGGYKKKVREAGSWIQQVEPYSPWTNLCEGEIRELKRGSGRAMIRTKSPLKLWDDCLELQSYIRSHTASDKYQLNGVTPETKMTGETPDISPFCQYQWYQWVKYYEETAQYPEPKQVLGRYLGPATDVGNTMTAKILKDNGNYRYTSTFRALTEDEIKNPVEKEAREEFTQKIHEKLGPGAVKTDFDSDLDLDEFDTFHTPEFEPYDDDDGGGMDMMPDRDELDHQHYDQYVDAEILLEHHGTMQNATVIGRARDEEGNMNGTASEYPILDTRTYMVRFPDGVEAEIAANVLAENMIAQCDEYGNQYLLMDQIVDHRSDEQAITKGNEYVTVNGKECRKKTTKGWEFCIQWKDGSTTWERLADIKESNPVEVAEYAVASSIDDEPAFAWWVPFTLKKRESIIAAVNKRYHKRTHKFGIRIPKSVQEAIELDRKNGNRLWQDALELEMKNVRVAFDIKGKDVPPPVGHQRINTHIVWDVKMENFRRKARLVAGGHTTESPPPSVTYASVVSRESVRIALTIAALNDLQVKTADILNAYLTAPLVTEKIYTICGPEFGEDEGKMAIIVRALYGLKSAGACFRNHLADCMRQLGYKSCKADPDVWMKAETREDGFKYYSYCLLYVDDVLMIHHDAIKALKELDHYFKMKEGSIGDPDLYLGAKLRKVRLPNGVYAWAFCPSKYVQEATKNVKQYLNDNCDGRRLPKRASAPFPNGYRPEIDVTEELDADQASYYHSQIGILRWMVELGRTDIITEVSMLASQMAMPRRGHLEAVFHIYAYLDQKHNSTMVFDPSYPEIDMRNFPEHDWKQYYGDAQEMIPPDMPEPRGKEVDLRLFVDSDHAGDRATRRSRTGYFIYLNMAPIAWYSKKQGTIETSVFGAEFVAMKNGMEALRGIRYKLRMMGVELSGPSFIYGDNMSVVHNTQKPESTLKKKSNSICYHAVRESVAMNESLVGHVRSENNPADICTKVISGGKKRERIVSLALYEYGTAAAAA